MNDMAVDIKTLRIGSHVEYEGERMMVYDISAEMNTPNHLIMLYQRDRFEIVSLAELSPIPITPELLKDLGFKFRKNADSWCISDKKGGYFYATIVSDGTCIVTHYPDFGRQSQAVCANLHELETFVYLIAKTELICQD